MYDLSKRRRAVRPSPLFLAFLAATAAGGALAWTQNGSPSRLGDFGVFVFVLAGWVVTLCLHEFAHAYAAYRAGDRSVEASGYLSLNPFKYAHPLFSIILPLLFLVQGGIGLPGGAVYLHPHAFRSNAARSIAAAVGPLTNLVFGGVLLTVAHSHQFSVFGDFVLGTNGVLYGSPNPDHGRFWAAVAFLGLLQITAAVLNLLPIPGLDGYAIIEPYLDPQTQLTASKVKPWGMVIVIVILEVGGLRTLFFRLVHDIANIFGNTSALSSFGYSFFQFWMKNPL